MEAAAPVVGITPRLLSRRETSIYLGLCATSLWKLEKGGELTAVRQGRRVLFDKSDLDAFIDRKKRS
jgi:excisionase family DNA binding protein